MRIAYFDSFCGVSGDMILGALVDAGLPLEDLARALQALGLGGYSLRARRVTRGVIAGTKVDVVLETKEAPFRHPGDLVGLVERSGLPAPVKAASIRVVERIRDAEAAVHGVSPEEVHLHEIGLVDTAVDVVGSVLGLHLLGVEDVRSSPVTVGRGALECRHGRLPVPAPAAAEILKGVPTREIPVEGEIATPTGAALLAVLSSSFGPRPLMTYDRVGYGAGDRDVAQMPNLLRLFLGDVEAGVEGDRVVLLETNVDDLSPQILAVLLGKVLGAGALDVWTTAVGMKKGRSGQVVSVLAPVDREGPVRDVLFRETTTLGVRRLEVDRATLPREAARVTTPFGAVRVKVATLPGGGRKAAPEFDDCLALAEQAGVPVREVVQAAQEAASRLAR